MNRVLAGLLVSLIVAAPAVQAQSPSDLAQTAAHFEGLQNPDGGFAASKRGPSALGATTSSIRILRYTGGSIPDVLGCIRFVKSCYDRGSGGFAQTPGGKPDVGTTASGLMALAELKAVDPAIVEGAIGFLAKNATAYEEIRIAVAGFEAVGKTSPVFARWTEQIQNGRNPDGTFGQGDSKAFETGGKAVALLRMGRPLEKKDQVVAFLKSAQGDDGGWSKGAGPSDLASTYRIMRAFYMLKETPDLDRLTAYIAHCRHADGTYGVTPTDPGPGGTYYAMIVLRWSRLLTDQPARVETAGFRALFNGNDLSGWEGDASLWSARDGAIVGSSTGLKHNDFLASQKSWRNFILKLTFRLDGGRGNSGVQFRSVRIPGHEMSGYQADIGQDYWGCLYDESRRNKVLVKASEKALATLRKDGWNQYAIGALGDRIQLLLNGKLSVRFVETDPEVARSGRFGLQMHAGGPIGVAFKDIYLQELPDPREDSAATPGFHLRTSRPEAGGRKYTLYLPPGYDGAKPFPVVLFLHGKGECGRDGVLPSLVGLGPAIVNRPEGIPAIVVFPQAVETWKAGSDDARVALAILDEVCTTFKTDRRRVVVTGLSMGGTGSWELAAAHPERFSAVVPVCGKGKPEGARSLAGLPLWAFVGDQDSNEVVQNNRTMIEAIVAAGGLPKYTEYRDVEHNSWDRAYNNRALVDWMLSRTGSDVHTLPARETP
jgi:pimeloyl-ACP methyl ester carboxylesterase/prenyltransferase beta subunit